MQKIQNSSLFVAVETRLRSKSAGHATVPKPNNSTSTDTTSTSTPTPTSTEPEPAQSTTTTPITTTEQPTTTTSTSLKRLIKPIPQHLKNLPRRFNINVSPKSSPTNSPEVSSTLPPTLSRTLPPTPSPLSPSPSLSSPSPRDETSSHKPLSSPRRALTRENVVELDVPEEVSTVKRRELTQKEKEEFDANFMTTINLAAIIRCQRLVRRWLAYKRLMNLVKQASRTHMIETEKLKKRSKTLNEVLSSELSYVFYLRTLQQYYKQAMQVLAYLNKAFTEQDVQIVFSNLDTIIELNTEVVGELDGRLKHWPSVQLFGDIFVRLAPIMSLYTEYINNFDKATSHLKELMSNDKTKKYFDMWQEKSHCRLDITSLLMMPVQRIPRYELLLKELIKCTEETHVDYKNLCNARDAIQKVLKSINEKKRGVDSQKRLVEIFKSIKNCPQSVLAPHRYFLCEGILTNSCTDHKYSGTFYYFLLNDLLVATDMKFLSNTIFNKNAFEFSHIIPVTENTRMFDVTDTLKIRLQVNELSDKDMELHTFTAGSAREKDLWITEFLHSQTRAKRVDACEVVLR